MEELSQLCENLQTAIAKIEDITERSLPLKKSAIISDLNLLRKMIAENCNITDEDCAVLQSQINKISNYITSHL